MWKCICIQVEYVFLRVITADVVACHRNHCLWQYIYIRNQVQWNSMVEKMVPGYYPQSYKVPQLRSLSLVYWERETEIEFWMPHTSRAWILKCPLQSWVLLNVSQGSEYPASRSSCRHSAVPPSPPKREGTSAHNQSLSTTNNNNNIFLRRTDYELTVTACDEHGGLLLLGFPRLFGRRGSLWRGCEGDRQVAGVLGGSGGTGQGGDGRHQRGGRTAVPSHLRGSCSGHDVDHGLLVALHAGTQLREGETFSMSRGDQECWRKRKKKLCRKAWRAKLKGAK